MASSRLVLSIVALVIGLIVAACNSQPAAPATPTVGPMVTLTPASTPADVTITLERTACHGTCPVYKLTINGNGNVVYDGHDFVINGKTKTVNHYYGDNSAPQELTDLESKIDTVVNSKQWTGK